MDVGAKDEREKMKQGHVVGLSARCKELIVQHGSIRAAARALRVDVGYFYRLSTGEKLRPSKRILARLGLKEAVFYHRV